MYCKTNISKLNGGVHNIMKKMIFTISLVLLILTQVIMGITVNATYVEKGFNDVSDKHWAKKAIDLMSDLGVIDGYGDGTFKPNNAVSRAEFAKMMVLALGLDLKSPEAPFFIDVEKKNWAYKYVETAKFYLTGYLTSSGQNKFKPLENAVREDMAVALVKVLGTPSNQNESLLDRYIDKNLISENIKPYVIGAINLGIMLGTQKEDGWYFNPQGELSRAEAAQLLTNILNEQKVTYDNDEEKVTFDEEQEEQNDEKVAPAISLTKKEDGITISWKRIYSSKLLGYKVVASKTASNPSYPENGYYKWITNLNTTSCTIGNCSNYNGSEFSSFEPGETYYFNVTAVYKDEKVSGTAIKAQMPGERDNNTQPSTSVKKADITSNSLVDGKIKLTWNKVDSSGFKYYKVVISKNNSNPKYSEDGYIYYFTDVNKTYALINKLDKYNNGDFGGYMTSGEKYYFSITAVYNNEKVAGNAISIVCP